MELELQQLTDALEDYRQDKSLSTEEGLTIELQVRGKEKESCLSLLRRKDLLLALNEKIGQSGIVGEENNRLMLFTIASSCWIPYTP